MIPAPWITPNELPLLKKWKKKSSKIRHCYILDSSLHRDRGRVSYCWELQLYQTLCGCCSTIAFAKHILSVGQPHVSSSLSQVVSREAQNALEQSTLQKSRHDHYVPDTNINSSILNMVSGVPKQPRALGFPPQQSWQVPNRYTNLLKASKYKFIYI